MIAAAPVASARPARFVGLRTKLLIGFTLVFTVVFAAVFYWFYTFAEGVALNAIRTSMTKVLNGAVHGIDVPELESLLADGKARPDGYSNDPRYLRLAKWLGTVRGIDDRAGLYVYVKGKKQYEMVFVTSSSFVKTPPSGVKFKESYVPTESPEVAWAPMDQNDTVYLMSGYVDKYGHWVSAYAPIRDASGKAVAALGMDYRADYVDEVRAQVRSLALLAFLIAYAVLLGLTFIVANTLGRPIVALATAARRIGEGNYDQDLTAFTRTRFGDEISALATVFQDMVAKVYTREQALRKEVQELRIEIDEGKRQKDVAEITESEFFKDLRAKARAMRTSNSKPAGDEGDAS
jgi:methyl-accepting chemotaxis protein